MAKIISVINLKGGVAKTTTTIQISECLASEFGKKVLIVDLDPQTNATIALIGEDRWEKADENKQTIFHAFNDKMCKEVNFDIKKAVIKNASSLKLKNLHLLPSSIRLIDIQDTISEIAKQTSYTLSPMEVLRSVISTIESEYDYIFIDCPPNLGFITKNGIEISDYYLIPTIPDTLSTYGIPQIVKQIKNFATERSLKIKCLGLVITKYVSNSTTHYRGIRTLPARFKQIFEDIGLPPSPVFATIMPQANATAEAMNYTTGSSLFKEKYGRSKSGEQYLYEYVIDLTKEFIKHAG